MDKIVDCSPPLVCIITVGLIWMAPISDGNKGYDFIEYYRQACVEYAKQKMSTPEFKIDINAPTVS